MGNLFDRRRRIRVNLPANLRASMGLAADVRVLNLSPGGAMIEHLDRLAPGQIYMLTLRLGGVDLRLRSRVVWCQVHGLPNPPTGEGEICFRSGLKLSNIPEGAEVHIRHHLATLAAPKSDQTHGLV